MRTALNSMALLLYLDIQWIPQSFYQQAYSLIPHRVKVLMDGLTPEHLLACNLKLHIRVTGPYKEKNEKEVQKHVKKKIIINK